MQASSPSRKVLQRIQLLDLERHQELHSLIPGRLLRHVRPKKQKKRFQVRSLGLLLLSLDNGKQMRLHHLHLVGLDPLHLHLVAQYLHHHHPEQMQHQYRLLYHQLLRGQFRLPRLVVYHHHPLQCHLPITFHHHRHHRPCLLQAQAARLLRLYHPAARAHRLCPKSRVIEATFWLPYVLQELAVCERSGTPRNGTDQLLLCRVLRVLLQLHLVVLLLHQMLVSLARYKLHSTNGSRKLVALVCYMSIMMHQLEY